MGLNSDASIKLGRERKIPKEQPLKFPKNKLYALIAGPASKIAMYILEHGFLQKEGKLFYDESKGMAWLSKMGRDLDGEVSRATIDEYLDTLLDEGILRHGDQEMQKVQDIDGTTKWVRAYYLGNEYLKEIVSIYLATHDVKGAKFHGIL